MQVSKTASVKYIPNRKKYSEDKPLRSDRIDFIYYQGKTIRAITSESYNQELTKPLKFMGEEFFYPSDHGFVMTTFKISPLEK